MKYVLPIYKLDKTIDVLRVSEIPRKTILKTLLNTISTTKTKHKNRRSYKTNPIGNGAKVVPVHGICMYVNVIERTENTITLEDNY